MRIITWNCQGAFRKKSEAILGYSPDILVVQECEHPDDLNFGSTIAKPTDYIWFGDNKHKGLGVFSYSEYRFQLLDCCNPVFKIIVPISVTGGLIDFNLFAIWANNPYDPYHRYIEQVWQAIYNRLQNIEIGTYDNWIMKSDHVPVIIDIEDIKKELVLIDQTAPPVIS